VALPSGCSQQAFCKLARHSKAAPAPRVFKDERVTVTAVNNTHFPQRSMDRMPHRSLAYRFDTRARSIVFSGDTAFSDNIVKLAQDADVLVCEIMDESVHRQMLERARADAAAGQTESVARHVAETHSTPEDVARMASAARVHTVVLNYLLPGPATGAGSPEPTNSTSRVRIPIGLCLDLTRVRDPNRATN
jgi:ribonuclease BN (tRNA processing enzyme)